MSEELENKINEPAEPATNEAAETTVPVTEPVADQSIPVSDEAGQQPQEEPAEVPYADTYEQPQIIVQKERGFSHYVGFALISVLCICFFFMPGIAVTFLVSLIPGVALPGIAAWAFSAILRLVARAFIPSRSRAAFSKSRLAGSRGRFSYTSDSASWFSPS